MFLEIFLADFAVFPFFWEFRGISRKHLNFAGPRPREISEALHRGGGGCAGGNRVFIDLSFSIN